MPDVIPPIPSRFLTLSEDSVIQDIRGMGYMVRIYEYTSGFRVLAQRRSDLRDCKVSEWYDTTIGAIMDCYEQCQADRY